MLMVLKPVFKGDVRRVQFDGTTVAELRALVSEEYGLNHFVMQHGTVKNNQVTLATDEGLKEALHYAVNPLNPRRACLCLSVHGVESADVAATTSAMQNMTISNE